MYIYFWVFLTFKNSFKLITFLGVLPVPSFMGEEVGVRGEVVVREEVREVGVLAVGGVEGGVGGRSCFFGVVVVVVVGGVLGVPVVVVVVESPSLAGLVVVVCWYLVELVVVVLLASLLVLLLYGFRIREAKKEESESESVCGFMVVVGVGTDPPLPPLALAPLLMLAL